MADNQPSSSSNNQLSSSDSHEINSKSEDSRLQEPTNKRSSNSVSQVIDDETGYAYLEPDTIPELIKQIPENLLTLRKLVEAGELAWVYGQLLPKMEDFDRLPTGTRAFDRLKTEIDNLAIFNLGLNDASPIRPISLNLYNHLYHTVRQVEQREAHDKLKALNLKKAALTAMLETEGVTDEQRSDLNTQIKALNQPIYLAQNAANKADLKEDNARKRLKPWPGIPEQMYTYLTNPTDAVQEALHVRKTYQPEPGREALLDQIKNLTVNNSKYPQTVQKIALDVYDWITPYLNNERSFLDFDHTTLLENGERSQFALMSGGEMMLSPVKIDNKIVITDQGNVVREQTDFPDEYLHLSSQEFAGVLALLKSLKPDKKIRGGPTLINQLSIFGLNYNAIRKRLDEEIKEAEKVAKEAAKRAAKKSSNPTVVTAEPTVVTAEPTTVSEISSFEPNTQELKEDLKGADYALGLIEWQDLDQTLQQLEIEYAEEEKKWLEKADEEEAKLKAVLKDPNASKEAKQAAKDAYDLAAAPFKNIETKYNNEVAKIQELERTYGFYSREELEVGIRNGVKNIIKQLSQFTKPEAETAFLTQAYKTLKISPPANAPPPPAAQDTDVRTMTPSSMIIADAPVQLAPSQPAPPELSDEDKQLIKIGKDLINLLNTRKTFNIKSSDHLLPSVNNLLRSLDEISNNYQQLLHESSKETERVAGMTNEHETLKQLLENTKVDLDNTRAQLDEKNRELDLIRTASEAPSTTATQGAGVQTTEPVRTKVITDEQRELRQQLNTSNLNLFRARSQLAKNDRIASKLDQQNAQNTENSIKILQNELNKTKTVNTRLRDELAAMRINLTQQIAKIEPPPPIGGVVVPAPQGVATTTFTTQTDPLPPPPPRSLQYTAEDYDNLLLERDELQRRLEHLTRQYNNLMAFTENQDFQTDERVVDAEALADLYQSSLLEEQRKNDELRLQLSHTEGQRRVLEGQLDSEAMRDQLDLIQTLQEQLNDSDVRVVNLNKQIDELRTKVGEKGMKNFRLKNRLKNLTKEFNATKEDIYQSHQDHMQTARELEETQDFLRRTLGNSESSSPGNLLNEISGLIQGLKHEKWHLERQLAEMTNEGQILRVAHEQAIKELTDKYEADLQEAKDRYDAKNRDTIAHYDQRLDAQIAQYDTNYGKFRRESEATLKETVNDYVVQIDGLKAAHEVQLARLDADYQAQITALQEELTARNSSLAALTNPNIDQYYRPFFESARVVLNQYIDLIRDEAVKDLPVVRDIFNVFMGDLKERLNLQREMEWQTFKTHAKTAIMTTEHQHSTDKQVLNQQAQENARYQNHQHDESMAKLRSDLEQKKKKRARRAEKQDAQLRAINAANIRTAHNQLASALIGRLIGSDNPAAVTHGYSMLAEFTKSLLTLPEDELNHPSIQEYIKMYNDGTLDRLVNVLAQPKQPVDDALSKRITDLEGTVRSFINITAQRTAHVGAAQAYHPPRRVFVGREGVPHQGNRYARGYRSNRRLPPRRPDGRFKRVSPARKHKK